MRPLSTVKVLALISVLGGLVLASPCVQSGAHTWVINELFSNADGTVQFVELFELNGAPDELGVNGLALKSVFHSTHTITLLHPIEAPTTNKYLLGGTAAFAALPGSPDLDFTIPDRFLNRTGADSIVYGPVPYDTFSYGAGQLPLNGINARRRGGTTGPNTPTNYAGVEGFVDASPSPPGVPDGTGGSNPMLVTPLALDGSSLQISWDTSICTGDNQHDILHGDGSMFPTAPGNPFGLLGSVCNIGASSPYTWNLVPTAADSTGILWWVVVVREGTKEGSWGTDSAGTERIGPGTGGSSGQCTVTSLSTTNVCGH